MKRLLAGLLALSMLFYVAPLSAFAASDNSVSQTVTVDSQQDANLIQAIASDPFLTQTNSAPQEQNATVDTSNVSMEATNSFGKLLLNGMNEENGSNFSSKNRIVDIKMNGNTATVKYIAEEDADLVVGIYADDAEQEMVASGTVAITATTDGTATVAITGSIPEYYVIKGYLFDKAEHAPLCDAFVDTVSTKAHMDVESATVDDFPEERVVNLDTDSKTNFIVVNNKVELVKNEGDLLGKNEVSSYDTSNEIYTISNASEEIRSLKAGQILVYEYEEGNLLVVRPEQVEVNGDTVTIYGDKNLELMDAFEMIKIDVSADTDDLVYEGEEYQESDDDSAIEDWNSVEETNAWKGEGHPKSNPIPLKVKAAEKNGIAVSLTGKMTIDTDFAYYATLEYQFAQMVTTTHITEGKLVVEAGNKPLNKNDVVQKELHGLTFLFPWGALKITPIIEIGVAGKGTINFESTVIKGSEYIHKGLLEFEKHELGKEPEFDIKSANVTGELSACVSFNTEACAVGMFDVYLVEVGLRLGFTWTGVFSPNTLDSADDTDDSIHLCKVCIKMTPKAKIDMGFVGKFLNSDKLTFEIMWPIAEETGDEKYISVTYKEIGFGECPHRLYRVDITFDGDNGEGHQVYGVNHRLLGNLNGKTLLGTLDSVGKTKAYLAPASGYEVSTTINGTEYRSDTFTVGYEPTSVTFGPGKKEPDPDKPEPDTPEGTVASGKCGDNLTWTLTSDGTLTIDGTGAMYDYSTFSDTGIDLSNLPPWTTYMLNKNFGLKDITVKKIILNDGITHIGEFGLYATDIEEITVPESVETIGGWAFTQNSLLKKVTLKNGVVSIGDFAFSGCEKLEELSLPETLEKINAAAFTGCTGLKEVTLPGSLKSIGTEAFTGTSLNQITIPGSVSDTGFMSFYECTNLESVVLLNGVTEISNSFGNCNLKSIEIPVSVTKIGLAAFQDCTTLEKVYYWGSEEQWKAIDISWSNEPLKNATVTYLTEDDKETSGNCGENLTWKLSDDGTLSISGNGTMDNYSAKKVPWNTTKVKKLVVEKGVLSIGGFAFRNCAELETVEIEDGVRVIGNSAFADCTSLKNVTLPASVTQIKENAFSGSGLMHVELPETLTEIGEGSFSNCTELQSITIPTGVKELKANTFRECTNLESVNLPENLVTIGDYAFHKCKNLKEIVIPDKVESIGEWAFDVCETLKKVELPDSITSLGKGAFADCDSLNEVILPENLSSIVSYLFAGCKNLSKINIPSQVTVIEANAFKYVGLTEIQLPDKLTSIGERAFAFSNLESLELPQNVKDIGEHAFYDCENLTRVILPDSITSIGSSAFESCKKLEDVNIPAGLKAIEDSTFKWCSAITKVKIPEGITEIQTNAFGNCKIKVLTLPASVISIGEGAFDCYELKTVIYNGTKAQWKAVEIEENNNKYLLSCTIHCTDGDIEPTAENSITTGKTTTDNTTLHAVFNGLTVGEDYAVIVSKSAENPLDAGNLIYINQKTAGANGVLDVPFISSESGAAYVVACRKGGSSTNPGGDKSDTSKPEQPSSSGGGGGAIVAVVLIGGAAAAVTAGVILMMPVEVSGIAQLGDGSVLANATVQLMKDGQQVAQTTTDESGHFALEVKRGEYQINVTTLNPETGEQTVRTASVKAPAKNANFVF